MATTSITITDEAYDYLKSIKGKRSFSEIILDTSRSVNDIMQFAGILKDADTKSVEDVREKINKDWNSRS